MPILRKHEVPKPVLPPEFTEHMGEAVREKFLENFHKRRYEARRKSLVELVASSSTIVLEVGSSIGRDEGSLFGYLTAKSGDKKLHDLDLAQEAIVSGKVRLSDFLACVRELDAEAVARVFDGKDGRPVITTVKSGEPIYSITAYPDTNAVFKSHEAELVANDENVLRNVMFSGAPATPVAQEPVAVEKPKRSRAKRAA